MEEALRTADEAGRVMASNKRLNGAIAEKGEFRKITDAFACWSGTMVGYDKHDQKLGKTIEYVDEQTGILYVFPVPEEHQGKKNVVLVAEHPNFTLKADGKTRIVQANEVGLVIEFPRDPIHNLCDPKYDIATGKYAEPRNKAARFFFRGDTHVGLVARGPTLDRVWRHEIDLRVPPCVELGVVVEAIHSNEKISTGTSDKNPDQQTAAPVQNGTHRSVN